MPEQGIVHLPKALLTRGGPRRAPPRGARADVFHQELAQRFKLRIRSEVRQVPIYVLTTPRNGLGPKIKRSDMNCVTLRAEQMRENKVP